MPQLTARLLGTPQLSIDGHPVELRSAKAEALLHYLVATRQVHSRDRLAGFFWPDVMERNALASLRTALYEIRQALGDSDVLKVDRVRLGIDPECDLVCDVDAVEAAGADPVAADEAQLLAAIEAYGGPFLQGISVPDSYDFDDWVFLERERYEHLYLACLCHVIAMYEQAGDFELGIRAARKVLAVDPLREDVHRQLMTLLARAGRRAEALEQYEHCVKLLRDELDIDPLPATQAVADSLRSGAGSDVLGGSDQEAGRVAASQPSREAIDRLAAAARAGSVGADRAVSTPTSLNRAAKARAASVDVDNPLETSSEPPLVGRQAELARLQGLWSAARQAHGSLVAVAGEAGIGKTRLVAELTAEACTGEAGDDAGAALPLVLVGRCFESGFNQPYGPFTEALRALVQHVPPAAVGLNDVWVGELARLMPELDAGQGLSNAPLDGVRDRDRLFEAVRLYVEAASAKRPLLWVLDDVQWSDETSLSLLAYLARRVADQPALYVLTYRPEELGPDRRRMLRALLGPGATVRLAPLSEGHVAELVGRLADAEDAPMRFGRALQRKTGGNPYFLLETLRALFDQKTLVFDAGVWTTTTELEARDYADLPVPDSVGLLIDARLDRLADDARSLLETAAVLRRDFSFDLVHSAATVPAPEALDALDALLSHGLVREMDADHDVARYDFAHAIVRERIYTQLSGARRQYLHRQIAGRLEALDPDPERIAYHYTRGGVRDRACAWSLKAGAAALAIYAAEDAEAHYRSALELAVSSDENFAAWQGLGDAQVLLGRPKDAVGSFESALEYAPEVVDRADLLRRIGRAQERQGNYDKALEAYGDARTALRGRPPSLTAVRVADGLATVYIRLGHAAKAVAMAEDALAWLQANPDAADATRAEAWIRNTLGMALVHAGEHEAAIGHLERSLTLKRDLDDRLGEATLLNNLGVVHYRLGNDREARDYYADSLAIKEAIGDGYGRAIALTNLALMETHLGELDSAAEHLETARRVAGDVRATWLLPEIRRVDAQRHLAMGESGEALRAAEEALQAAEELGVPNFIGVAHRELGRVKGETDLADAAREHFLTSIAVFEMQSDDHELAKTRAAFAEMLIRRGHPDEAEEHLTAALEVFRRTGAQGRLERLRRLRAEDTAA